MNKEFITLKEAGKLVDVSPMTIRRYAFRILKSKKDVVRADVKVPSKTNYPYKIAKDRVLRKFGKEKVKESYNSDKENVKEGLTNIDNKLLETLTAQLQVKDDQIKAKDEQINNLSERLKESHILLLGQPKTSPEPTVFNDQEQPGPAKEEPQETIKATTEEGLLNTEKESIEKGIDTNESQKPKKKGLLNKLFG